MPDRTHTAGASMNGGSLSLFDFIIQSVQQLALLILTTLQPVAGSQILTVTDPAWTNGKWEQIGGHPAYRASSTELIERCKKNPSSFLILPLTIQATQILYIDGRSVVIVDDPSFRAVRAYYGYKEIKCSDLPADAQEMTWEVRTHSTYFARVMSYPQVSETRDAVGALTIAICILGAGGCLAAALMVLVVFLGKFPGKLVFALAGTCVLFTLYGVACVPGDFGITISMLNTHRVAVTVFWVGVTLLFYTYKLIGALPKWIFGIFLATALFNLCFMLAGTSSDTLMLGSLLNFPMSSIVLYYLFGSNLRKALKAPRDIAQWGFVASALATMTASHIDMMVLAGTLKFPVVMPLGVLGGIFFLIVSLSIMISRTYEERDHLRENLEQEVEKKTALLASANKSLDGMINSLGQGFTSFNANGACAPVSSRACEQLFGVDPASRYIWEVLRLEGSDLIDFNRWIGMCFAGSVDFTVLEKMAPKEFKSTDGRYIPLQFFPIRNKLGTLTDIVVVATDKTAERKANLQLEEQRRRAEMILMMAKEKKTLKSLVSDLRESFKSLSTRVSGGEMNREIMLEYARLLHTFKGAFGIFAMRDLAELFHRIESEWSEERATGFKSLNGAVSQQKCLTQLNMLLDVVESTLEEYREVLGRSFFESGNVVEVKVEKIDKLVLDLRHARVDGRLVTQALCLKEEPILNFFTQYVDVVNRLSQRLRKRLRPVEISGGDLMIVPDQYRNIFASFVHVFANSVDHGLETPAERREVGKDPAGKISISFTRTIHRNQDAIQIVVTDDGRGIDPSRITEKLSSMGVNVEGLSPHEILNKIFDPGFSTRTVVTETSGRGIGLDALKSSVEFVGGTVFVESDKGKGSRFTVTLPVLKPAMNA